MQQEREAYQKAFDMLRELRYAQATAAFREFLKSYPKGRYAHIAQYWLGEAGYAQRDFRQAITDYNALLVNFPESPKLAEAMLKMGYSYYELKEPDQARKILEQLLQQYPDSTEAGQARNLLKRIDKNAG
jgi:tol-pal system protein YbgF